MNKVLILCPKLDIKVEVYTIYYIEPSYRFRLNGLVQDLFQLYKFFDSAQIGNTKNMD